MSNGVEHLFIHRKDAENVPIYQCANVSMNQLFDYQ